MPPPHQASSSASASGNKTMRSIFLDATKGNNAPRFYVESNEAIPSAGPSQVLVEVKAVALAVPCERVLRELFRKGQSHQHVSRSRFSVGQDVAGVVKQVGSEVSTLAKGDHVVGIIPLDYCQSGCAEYVVLHEFDVVKKPEEVSFVDAAGCIGDAVKAYTALHYLGRMCSGDSVLVLDGASAFGSIALQLAHHWGAKILTTCASQDEKLYLESLAPQIVTLDLRKKNSNLKSMVMLETGGLGTDIIIDPQQQGNGSVNPPPPQSPFSSTPDRIMRRNQQNKSNSGRGNNALDSSSTSHAPASMHMPSKHDLISCLGVGARWITSRPNMQLDPPNSRLLFLKCASLGFLFEQAWMLSSAQQGRYQHILMDVMEKVASSTIRPNIHHTVTFESATEALKGLDEIRVGKVVMTT